MISNMISKLIWLMGPFIDYVATNHRSLAMIIVVLPLSFILRNVLAFRYVFSSFDVRKTNNNEQQFNTYSDFVYRSLFTSSKGHDARVARVAKVVSDRHKLPKGHANRKPMCTARAPWQNLSTRFSEYKKNSTQVFVGDFRNILSLDTKNNVVHIEPLVEVGQITRWLIPRGYMLATTLEIDEATVGGLSMAVGMTTASHKFGLLQETVLEYEMVMGDGTVRGGFERENNNVSFLTYPSLAKNTTRIFEHTLEHRYARSRKIVHLICFTHFRGLTVLWDFWSD